MKLIAIDKHNKKRKPSEVIGIKRDGWVITEDGAFGDYGPDCDIEVDLKGYLKNFRISNEMSQQEMAWMLNLGRTTYINLEKGKREITLKEFLILSIFLPDTEFYKLKTKLPKK